MPPQITVYKDGVPHEPTLEERMLPTAAETPYKGCPTFVVSQDGTKKFWCQAGGRNHEGTHNG